MSVDLNTWVNLESSASLEDTSTELMHPCYKYPAGLSPFLVRAIIQSTTKPGDLIIDPFCGGGTTAIEAIALGRKIVASDLNALSCFVTLAKAYPLIKKEDRQTFQSWVERGYSSFYTEIDSINLPVIQIKNSQFLDNEVVARLLYLCKVAKAIHNPPVRRLALLSVLRLGQIFFDCQIKTPKNAQEAFLRLTRQIANRAEQYAQICLEQISPNQIGSFLRVIRADASAIKPSITDGQSPRLVLTSPPYPNIHVLYNRWQFRGRRETNLPYALLGITDGLPASFYTLAPRRSTDDEQYFERLKKIWVNLKSLLGPETIVAQVISFPHPEYQLPKFRELMRLAGYREITKPNSDSKAELITRKVPNRRWYTKITPTQCFQTEYLFLHCLDNRFGGTG